MASKTFVLGPNFTSAYASVSVGNSVGRSPPEEPAPPLELPPIEGLGG